MSQRKINPGHQAVIDTLARPDLNAEHRVQLAKSLAGVEKVAIQLQVLRERIRKARKKAAKVCMQRCPSVRIQSGWLIREGANCDGLTARDRAVSQLER